MEEEKKNEEAQKELKDKELFSIILDYKVKEDDSYSVTISSKKDDEVSELKLLDERFLNMAYEGLKVVFGQVAYFYVKTLRDHGKMSDEQYNKFMKGE
jgi:hypothetical protein